MLLRATALCLFIIAACTPAESDLHRFLAATRAEPSEALILCKTLVDPTKRGDCTTTHVVRLIQETGAGLDEARSWCGTIPTVFWQEECHFEVGDALGLEGSPALRACARAGRFEVPCLRHAAGRALGGTTLARRIGEEALLEEQVSSILGFYGIRDTQTRDALVARVIADRWARQPFEPRACGAASEASCVLSFRYAVLLAASENAIRVACTASPALTTTTLADLGGPAVTPDGFSASQEAWSALCADVTAREAFRTGTTRDAPPLETIPLKRWGYESRR